MGDNKKQDNDFLNEIQEKINKRSGGLYYNQKLKSVKKSLSITSFIVIFVIILWVSINFISQRISISSDIKPTGKSHSKVVSPSDKSKLNIEKIKTRKLSPPIKKTPMLNIKKQKYRYIFTSSKKIDTENSKILKKVFRKYKKTEEKEFYIFLIPEAEIKNILKIVLNTKLELKKESYSDLTDKYQISIKKSILK